MFHATGQILTAATPGNLDRRPGCCCIFRMSPTPRCGRMAVRFGLLALLGTFAGCASVSNEIPPPGAKIVDGEQVVTMDAPVGSHIKPHVKVKDLKSGTIAPTRTAVITDQTDTMIMPPTAGEMSRMLGGGGGGPIGR
jgi:hypothetical protein